MHCKIGAPPFERDCMNEYVKLNLGCGTARLPGFINVDKFGSPDQITDLEQFPWPWETNSVLEIKLFHVLEHLGESSEVFIKCIKELYRISVPNALIEIRVPHPRHDDFLNDPTHVRPITLETMALFSKSNNRYWEEIGASNSQLGVIHNVDFEIVTSSLMLDSRWITKVQHEQLSDAQIHEASLAQNNVIKEIRFTLKVIKND